VAQADLLRDVLELAHKEKALEGEALVSFATALRDRANLVLAERIEPLDERIRSLEARAHSVDRENAWRREAMQGLEERVRGLEGENAWRREALATIEERARGLEAENAWRREAMAALEASVRALESEGTWRRASMASLEERVRELAAELQTLAGDHAQATRAHAELLAHHGHVVRQVIAETLAVAALPWTHVRQARGRLAALAELLRPEAP
jgi:chromosome segregation ATPase